jgi:hypothetical protein
MNFKKVLFEGVRIQENLFLIWHQKLTILSHPDQNFNLWLKERTTINNISTQEWLEDFTGLFRPYECEQNTGENLEIITRVTEDEERMRV